MRCREERVRRVRSDVRRCRHFEVVSIGAVEGKKCQRRKTVTEAVITTNQ